MLCRSFVLIALATSLGCTALEGDETSKPAPRTTKVEPKPEPEPEPEPQPEPEPEPQPVLAKASIASVTMIQDCPDDPPPPPKPSPAAQPVDQAPADEEPTPGEVDPAFAAERSAAKMAPGAALGDGPGWSPPCDQSTVQISFTGQGDAPGRVMIERVRLLEPEGSQELARLSVRHPATWTDEGYFSWDETIPAGGNVKASYSLSLPNWSEVERKKAGASSFGHMFVLEIEVSIDGVSQTIRSQQFPREEAHVVVT